MTEQTQNKREKLPIEIELVRHPLRHEAVLNGAEVDDCAMSYRLLSSILVKQVVNVRISLGIEKIGEDRRDLKQSLQHADREVPIVGREGHACQSAEEIHDILTDIAIGGVRIHHCVDAVDVRSDHLLGELH